MRKTIIFVLALALACVTLALAQPPPAPPPGAGRPGGPGGGMRGGMMGMMSCPVMAVAPPQTMMIERNADTLALTDDQKTKLTAALTKSETALATLRQNASAASKALREAVMAPTFDGAKVATLLADAQKADAAISTAEIQTWTEIRGILTADQIAKLAEAMSRRTSGFGGPGGNPANRGSRNRGGQPGAPPQGPPPEAPPPDAPAPPDANQ